MPPSNRHPREIAKKIVRTLVDAGHVAYFNGGCVRDELLDLHPKDYDVATEAPPDRVASLFSRTREVGKAFGVVHVYESGETIEVATFRSEGPYTDKRRPDHVTFCDAEHDAQRRDFTINAMFIDPLDESEREGGRVIDYVKGRADLDRRVVRAVGDPEERLAEDHLRALRAVRFTARLGFEIEPKTADAIRRHASELKGVSRERIGEEARAMLAHPSRAVAAALIQSLQLDGPTLDEAPISVAPLANLAALPADSDALSALAAWTIDRLDHSAGGRRGPGDLDSALPALIPRLRAALCLANDERDALRAILTLVANLERDWPEWGDAKRKRAAVSQGFQPAIHILSTRANQVAKAVRADVAALAEDGIGLQPPRLITGDDLVAAGLKPGKMFGIWLDNIYDMQLEGALKAPQEAIDMVLEWSRTQA